MAEYARNESHDKGNLQLILNCIFKDCTKDLCIFRFDSLPNISSSLDLRRIF